MTRFHDSELSHRIDDTILAHLETGEPTADEVSQDVLIRYAGLIRDYGQELAKAQVRSIVSDRMKKTLATKKGKSRQLRLDIQFGALELESALTFRDDFGTVRYVATARANADHHQRYIALLHEQIQADTARLKTSGSIHGSNQHSASIRASPRLRRSGIYRHRQHQREPMKNNELREVEARLQANLRKRDAIARLREICLPYMRDNPAITVGEALKLDRKARPWAYRSAK